MRRHNSLHLQQAGFGIVEWLLITVGVVLIGATSWYVWHSRQVANATYTRLESGHPVIVHDMPHKQTDHTLPTIPAGATLVDDSDNGKTVTVPRGHDLYLQLASLYWGIDPAADQTILKTDGQPVSNPAKNVIPGTGAGTLTQQFTALQTGTTTVTASRTTCGEALACTGNSGSYSVTVIVK